MKNFAIAILLLVIAFIVIDMYTGGAMIAMLQARPRYEPAVITPGQGGGYGRSSEPVYEPAANYEPVPSAAGQLLDQARRAAGAAADSFSQPTRPETGGKPWNKVDNRGGGVKPKDGGAPAAGGDQMKDAAGRRSREGGG